MIDAEALRDGDQCQVEYSIGYYVGTCVAAALITWATTVKEQTTPCYHCGGTFGKHKSCGYSPYTGLKFFRCWFE